jgi:hypothetical protein
MLARFKIVTVSSLLLVTLSSNAQQVTRIIENYDPHNHKIIPDKVFEMGLPLLFLYLIANTVVSVLKNKAEYRLKEKAIDKGISEATLIAVFGEDKSLARLAYYKWFLVLAALGISLLAIHIFSDYLKSQSGYLALGIITLLQAIAFLIYYRTLKSR